MQLLGDVQECPVEVGDSFLDKLRLSIRPGVEPSFSTL